MPFLPPNQQCQSTREIIILSVFATDSQCPITKFEGGLNLLQEADDDTVMWLESTATAALAK